MNLQTDIVAKRKLVQQYAERQVSWRELQARGFSDYLEVLGLLGELGLRPPIAEMSGPNRASRERGRALLRAALTDGQ